jgi:hypothetical protein
MSIIPKIQSKEVETVSLGSQTTMSCEKLPVEYIINIESPVITDPIDPPEFRTFF